MPGALATGAEVERALVSRGEELRRRPCWSNGSHSTSSWRHGRCVGVVALDPDGIRREVRARHVVLATGGAGQLYSVTTNPSEATGDGIAMALRAGVAVCDIEFFQFHPTALHHPAMPRPLLSEALAGSRRVVARRAGRTLRRRARLARRRQPGHGARGWPTKGSSTCGSMPPAWSPSTTASRRLALSLRGADLDPAVDWLPIAPAAHYLSGGIVTDLDGATTLGGLWAVGEVACTGVHGANRLASNSLLEGMVFGARLAEAIEAGKDCAEPTGVMDALDAERAEHRRTDGPVVDIGLRRHRPRFSAGCRCRPTGAARRGAACRRAH